MTLPKFEYFAPDTLEEALRLLKEKGEGTHLLAGGTDLVVKMNHGVLKPKIIIGLKRIEGMNKISFNKKKGLTIGATTSLSDVANHPSIRKHYPSVSYAARNTANTQIRNMGTVAGNLCNAAPSAENAPTLIVMGAEVTLASIEGERKLPLEKFFLGPGLPALESGEVLKSIFVPLPPSSSGTSYQHISARGKVDISAVCVGVMMTMKDEICGDVKIALGAVGPIPMRALETEKIIRGKKITSSLIDGAGVQSSKESKPISDVRASAEYRKKIVEVLTKRALREACKMARKR